jgi:hypothetical protein
MSQTYKISDFSSILDMSPSEACSIFKRDSWFPSTSSRYVQFVINNKKIIFIERSNEPKEGFIKIDSSMNPETITVDSELDLHQFASVVFSVNGNKGVFILLKKFIKKIKQTESEYYSCISNKNMKIFAAHIAWLKANIGDNKKIPEWIYSDPLFSEIAKQYESMTRTKLYPSALPDLEKGMNIFSNILFLCFMMVRDRCNDIIYRKHPTLYDQSVTIIKNIDIDIKKFNEVCVNISLE